MTNSSNMLIQDTVSAGFQVMKADWKQQADKFDNVEEQMFCHVSGCAENNPISEKLRQLKNEVELLQSSMAALNNELASMI